MSTFYEENPDKFLLQGDIIKNVPLIDTFTKEQLEPYIKSGEDKAQFRATVYFRNVILISQTCDIDRVKDQENGRSNILVAPIVNLKKIEEGLLDLGRKDDEVKGYIGNLKSRKVKYQFYLPPFDNFEESCAELMSITNVSGEYIDLNNRLASMTHYGRSFLSHSLLDYLDRTREWNVEDPVACEVFENPNPEDFPARLLEFIDTNRYYVAENGSALHTEFAPFLEDKFM